MKYAGFSFLKGLSPRKGIESFFLVRISNRKNKKLAFGFFGVLIVMSVAFIIYISHHQKTSYNKRILPTSGLYSFSNVNGSLETNFIKREDPTHLFTLQDKKNTSRMSFQIDTSDGKKDLSEIDQTNDTLTIQNVYPFTDFSYKITESGVKEEIILHKKDAIKTPEQKIFAFYLRVKDLVPIKNRDGSIGRDFVNPDTQTTYTIMPPFMTDASGTISYQVGITIVSTDDAHVFKILLVPNSEWLHSSDRVFPIIIDPTVVRGDPPAGIWKLDEGYGTTTHDDSVNQNDLTITNASWRASRICQDNNCMYFDGTGDYLSAATSTSGVGVTAGSQTFTTSGTFTSPTGITVVTVEAWGGGGGGGRARGSPSTGGGGAGGSYALKSVGVTAGSQYTVNVGIGGTGSTGTGAQAQNGSDGKPSWFQSVGTVYAEGGAKGLSDGNVNSTNGSPGVGSTANTIGDIRYRGGNASTGDYTSGSGYSSAGGGGAGSTGPGGDATNGTGGSGTSTNGGNGANGVGNNSKGGNGSTYGGGGSGGKANNTTDRNGGNGADGLVVVSWDAVAGATTGVEYLVNGSFSVETWFRRATVASTSMLINQYSTAGYKLYMNSNGTLTCGIDDDSTWSPDASVTTSTSIRYDNNKWYHVSCVKNSTTSLSIYVNGILVAQNTSISSVTTVNNTANIYVGIDSDASSNPWQGFLDDIKVYDYARTADQVKLDAIPGSSDAGSSAVFGRPDNAVFNQSLVGYWKLDETSAPALDSSGVGNTGSWNGDATSGSGKFGKAIVLDGTGDYVQIDSTDDDEFDVSASDNFSFGAWVKLNDNDTIQSILNKSNGSLGSANIGFDLIYRADQANNAIQCRTNDGNTSTVTLATTAVNVSDGQWHFIMCTFNRQGNFQLFADGKLQDSASIDAITGALTVTNPLRIGSQHNASQWYAAGRIDDVRFYRRALTPAEVERLYNSGTSPIAYWNFDENSGTTPTTGSVDVKIATGDDDAEEHHSDGVMDLTSSDLEITYDEFSFSQVLGLRFVGITVPNSAVISNAFVQFSVDNDVLSMTGADSAYVLGEAADSASAFTGTNYNISSRSKTSSTVPWNSIPSWTYPATGADQKTPDISTVIQEIVDRDGWSSGNNMVIMVDGTNTTYRIAQSYNTGTGATVPQLTFNYASGPTAYAHDSSGNNNAGTLTNFFSDAWTPGKYGSALNFDGSSTSIIVPDNPLLDADPRSFTYEAWIKVPADISAGSGTLRSIFSKYITSGNEPRLDVAIFKSSGLPTFTVESSTNTDTTSVNGTTDLRDNQWHHIAAVRDRDRDFMYLYIDGVLEGSTTDGDQDASNNGSLYIGDYGLLPANGRTFLGKIDEAKVYDYARSPAQIIEDLNGGHPVGGSPVGSQIGYWMFDEGYGTTAYNGIAGNSNLTLSTAAWTASGKYAIAWDGSGSGRRLSMGADDSNFDFDGTDDFTISLWARSDSASNPSGNQFLVDKEAGIGYGLYFNNSGQVVFGIDDDASWTPDDTVTSTADLFDGSWHYILARKTGTSRIDLFVDGLLNASNTSLTATGTLANSDTLTVGDQDTSAGNEFTGDIDELKIYRAALTSEQMNVDFNQGKAIALGAKSTAADGKTADNSLARAYCVPGDSTSCASPLGEWKFDERTGTSTLNDTSGNGRSLTMGNFSSNAWIKGKNGSALEFDGTSNFAYTSSLGLGFTSATVTVSAWVNSDSFAIDTEHDRPHYVAMQPRGAWGDARGYYLAATTAGLPTFTIGTTADSSWHTVTGSTTMSTGTWYYLTGSYDGASLKIYVNGLLDGVAAQTGTIRYDDHASSGGPNPGTFYIGVQHDNTSVGPTTLSSLYILDGRMDTVRVYGYARTPAQIAWEYNQGGPLAWYRFDECQGTVLYNATESGNGRHLAYDGTIQYTSLGYTSAGTCSSGTGTEMWNQGTTGKINSSLGFDGTDDYVDIPDTSALRFDGSRQSFSIATWAKRGRSGTAEYIISKEDADNDGWRLQFDSGNTVTCSVNSTDITSVLTISDTNWHHIACSVDRSGNGRVYIDGIPTGTAQTTSAITMATTTNIRIARQSYAGANYFLGQIDDLRLFNYPLSAAQVRTTYNNGAVSFK